MFKEQPHLYWRRRGASSTFWPVLNFSRLRLVALLLVAALALAACGGDSTETATPDDAVADELDTGDDETTTEAPETTAAPETTTEVPETTTAPETTEAPEAEEAPESAEQEQEPEQEQESEQEQEPEPTPPPAANGATLFASNCASCHGADAGGSSSANIQGFPEATTQSAIINGLARMPAFPDLNAQEVAAIASHVNGL